MMADIKERLRKTADEVSGWGAGNEAAVAREAADHIEALDAKVAGREAERDIQRDLKERAQQDVRALSTAHTTAEARLSEALAREKVLRDVLSDCVKHTSDMGFIYCEAVARAVLSEQTERQG